MVANILKKDTLMEIKLLTLLDTVFSLHDIYVDLTDYERYVSDEWLVNGTVQVIKFGDNLKDVVRVDIAINRLNFMMTDDEILEIVIKSRNLIKESLDQLVRSYYVPFTGGEFFNV